MDLKSVIKKSLRRRLVQRIRGGMYAARMRKSVDGYDPEMSVVKMLVQANDDVVDLGASLGWYTRLLSHVVGLSHVRGILDSDG